MSRNWMVLLPLLLGCAGGMGAPAGAPLPTGSFRAEDRVVLGDFSMVQAIASSYERVYVVYPSAVAEWDPLRRAWQVPRQAPTPDALARVHSAVIDPLDHALWLGGDDGLIHFEPLLDRWERLPIVGRVRALALDATDPARGVWVQAADGWWVIQPGGIPVRAVPPNTLRAAPTIEDAYRDLPMLRAMGPTLSLGPGLSPGRLTAAAPMADQGGWFIGTDRHGLLAFDRFTATGTPMTPGLPGELIGALAAVPGGVWVTTDEDIGRGVPAAVSFVPDDLSGTLTHRGDPVLGLGFAAVRRVVPGDRMLWLASDRGLARYDIDADRMEWWNEAGALRDQRVITALPWQDGLMIGTMRGLEFVDHAGEVALPAPNLIDPVYALFAWRDTLWVGTARGVVVLAAGDTGVRVAAGWRANTSALQPVVGIGLVADTLVALTRELLVRRDPGTSEWIAGAPTAATTGALRAFHATSEGVWIGGDRAAAFVTASGAVVHFLMVGRELPGPVTAITTSPGYLWVGTTRGLVRLTLRGG